MGQVKYNPTAIAAKKGELGPKERPIGKVELRRFIQEKLVERLIEGHPQQLIQKDHEIL